MIHVVLATTHIWAWFTDGIFSTTSNLCFPCTFYYFICESWLANASQKLKPSRSGRQIYLINYNNYYELGKHITSYFLRFWIWNGKSHHIRFFITLAAQWPVAVAISALSFLQGSMWWVKWIGTQIFPMAPLKAGTRKDMNPKSINSADRNHQIPFQFKKHMIKQAPPLRYTRFVWCNQGVIDTPETIRIRDFNQKSVSWAISVLLAAPLFLFSLLRLVMTSDIW